MEQRYKVVLSNKWLYKEIELPPDKKMLTLGTMKDSEVRWNKENFFEDFQCTLSNNGETWSLQCDSNVYISNDGIMKMFHKELTHGTSFFIKYQSNNQEVFHINFVLDFDFEKRDYEKVIDISFNQTVTIGGKSNCDIILKDELMEHDVVSLKREQNKLMVIDHGTKYGVYINGSVVKGKEELKDYDFLSILGYSFYYREGKLYTSSISKMEIPILVYSIKRDSKSHFQYPKFNRNTRILSIIPEDAIDILDPPQQEKKPKRNIIMNLLPALVMLGLTVVLRGLMGNGGGTFIIMSVVSMSMGIITTIYGFIDSTKEYKVAMKKRKKVYNKYIENKRNEIEILRNEELHLLNDKYFSLEEEINMVEDFSGDLFNRTTLDEDFLDIRIGTGHVESKRQVDYKKQETYEVEDPMQLVPEEVSKEYENIKEAPIVIKLGACNSIGVVGEKIHVREICKNMLLDLSIRQYYSDVKLFFIGNEENSKEFSWIRLLPHISNDELGIRNIVCDEESKNILFDYLYKELSRREQEEGLYTKFIIFVYDDMGIKRHPISKYVTKGKSLCVTFVFFEQFKEQLPVGCDQIVILNRNEAIGKLIDSADSTKVLDFSYDMVEDKVAESIAVKLSPVYCEEVSLEGSLTKSITLFELLNIYTTEDLEIGQRWRSSEVYKTMAAPLGVNAKNEIISLDLNEKHHGPHGLVAGTTGSGKSEILQSYILSMATLFHPYEVGFVIIDFKGGGMVNQFKELPHLIGAITNIDGREIDRSLLSIKAELRKRQELFAKANVNHVDNYIKKFKANEVSIPLPHLILVVDEFAELKMDQPEFMKELISAARIGRSLGVHLILATQKPSGVVDAQIWSNSKFKLCLKVQNKEDSNEVLKTPLAAEIKEPGRAYLQVGNNEIFELFQSAYSGAYAKRDENANQKEYTISTVSLAGLKDLVYKSKKKSKSNQAETQLEAVVKYVHDYCEKEKIVRLPGICLPPLQESIPYERNDKMEKDIYTRVPLGIFDDPNNQRQEEVTLELLSSNTLIIGSSQYGKTCLLQTVIRAVADYYTPEEVSLYILDFASMALNVFESLNHVGGVVLSGDDEKLKSLLRMMQIEMRDRKESFSRIGVTSFASYKEAGHRDFPHIILFIDNFFAFKELYPDYEEQVLYLLREGSTLGISIITTSKQSNGIGYKYLNNFANRICLYCNSSDEYRSMFDKCRIEPKNVPGRGIIELNKSMFEYQTYLAFKGEKEIERVEAIREFIRQVNGIYENLVAKQIPSVPSVLDYNYIETKLRYKAVEPYVIPYGIDYDSVELCKIDLLKTSMLSITGAEKFGKTNMLYVIFHYLRKNMMEYPVKAYIIDDYRKKLASLKNCGFVEQYTIDTNEFDFIMDEMNQELVERFRILQEDGMEALQDKPLLLCVVKNPAIYNPSIISTTSMNLFKEIQKSYKQLKVCFIFADVDNTPLAYSASDIMKYIRDNRNMFVMDNIANLKIFDLPLNTIRQFKKEIELGDSYYVTEKNIIRCKIINGRE